MRIYGNCYELQSEILREVWEMGKLVHPETMQNKKVGGDEAFITKEIINYSYCLLSMYKEEFLFLFEGEKSKAWCKAEFAERISRAKLNPGYAWRLREDLWRQFADETGAQDYTYSERIGDNLDKVCNHLIMNPNSRQAILSIWDRTIDIDGIGGKKRVPCSVYYQFIIRDKQVHIIYNQRSADVVTHFGNDVYLAWQLMEYVARETLNKPGHLYHNITSLHSYQKDWAVLKQGISTIGKLK